MLFILFSYNRLNKPLTETDSDGNTLVSNFYKDDIQLTIITNALAEKTTILYDRLSQQISTIDDSLGNIVNYSYIESDLITEINANGIQTNYQRSEVFRGGFRGVGHT